MTAPEAPGGPPLRIVIADDQASVREDLVLLTNPEIAARLFLSNHTVKTHINRIFAKTGSRDRAAAIGYAHRSGIG